MGTVIVGSVALNHILGRVVRQPKDLDIISATYDGGVNLTGTPELTIEPFFHPKLDKWTGSGTRYASLDELYTLKVSHSYWELKNGSWDKHIHDLRLLKSEGARLDLLLHDELYEVWVETHGPKRSNLYMEKEGFFKDAVERIYDHDSIHESVSYGDTAMYNQILKDGSTVDIDSKKMWSLGYDNLILLFREEVYATALERILIPRGYRGSPGSAYRWALRRTITSLTKGRSARFIVDNFEQFALPDLPGHESYLVRHLRNRDKLIPIQTGTRKG